MPSRYLFSVIALLFIFFWLSYSFLLEFLFLFMGLRIFIYSKEIAIYLRGSGFERENWRGRLNIEKGKASCKAASSIFFLLIVELFKAAGLEWVGWCVVLIGWERKWVCWVRSSWLELIWKTEVSQYLFLLYDWWWCCWVTVLMDVGNDDVFTVI